MFCGTLLTIKVESLLLAGFLSLAQRKGGVGKSVRRDFNLNYELGILVKERELSNNEHENVTPL